MPASTPRVSAADVTFPASTSAPAAPAAAAPARVPTPSAAAPSPDFDGVLHGVWQLLGSCPDANRNDRLAVAIEKLIAAGVDTRARIVGAARSLGFNPAHAGALLDRERRRWRRGGDGVYRLGGG